jgi:hypothetical protein
MKTGIFEVTVISEGEERTFGLVFEVEEKTAPSIGGFQSTWFEAVSLSEVNDEDGAEVNVTERERTKFFEKFKYQAEEEAERLHKRGKL